MAERYRAAHEVARRKRGDVRRVRVYISPKGKIRLIPNSKLVSSKREAQVEHRVRDLAEKRVCSLPCKPF